MTTLPRARLGCGCIILSGSRCTRCATKVQRTKRQRRPYTAADGTAELPLSPSGAPCTATCVRVGDASRTRAPT
jgi:hypothetical protein